MCVSWLQAHKLIFRFRNGFCQKFYMNPEIRSQFAALEKYTYLNSAAVSPIPRAAIDAAVSQLNDVANHGSEHYTEWVATKDRARTLLAGMLNVRPEQVAFMRNTSDGFASIANGIDWKKGDNIVSFEGEFPANFYPWRMVRDRYNVELRLSPERDGRIDIEEFISLIDSNTKLVSISAVQYASGFQADLERIGRAARSVDALFAVDIIQALGAKGFDLPAQFVDIAAGASHKWLCAPEGCGMIYLSDRARDMLEPSFVGWISVETPWDFADREQGFKPNALALESGTGASALFYGLEQSLKLLTETGLDRIERYLADLSDLLCDSLAGKNYNVLSSRAPRESSPIVCVQHAYGIHCNDIAKKLQSENIIVSPRGDRLRIAPHFYSNSEDIARLIEALP
jgi:cysteine desulfurase / selenocysteine lyase